jgi:TPR repeat protein
MVFSLISNQEFGICLYMRNLLSILLIGFVLASCGEEKTVEGEKTVQERAEEGDAAGQFELGDIYYKGKGVPLDYDEALKWYRKAADQGDAEAQFALGGMYSQGQGVPKDYTKAYVFFNIAAAQGSEKGKTLRDMIKEDMPKEEIAEGQKLTREWLERKAKENGE